MNTSNTVLQFINSNVCFDYFQQKNIDDDRNERDKLNKR